MTARRTIVLALVLLGCSDGSPSSRSDGGTVDLDGSRPPDTRWLFFDTGPLPDIGQRDARFVDFACLVGFACTPDRGCPRGDCQAESVSTFGPDSGCPTESSTFIGGYCTPGPLALPTTGCDPTDEMACGDPDCSKCVDLGGVVMCMRSCTPTAFDNSECPQDHQTCVFGDGYCIDGCRSDDECRDEDGDGCPDPGSLGTCNLDTRRCDHPPGGLLAGDPCTRDRECETNGECIAGWPGGGYCTRFGCDVPGIECAAGGRCQSRRVGVAMCGWPCTVAAEARDPMLVTGAMGHGADCRPGYACTWDGIGGAGTINGVCLPGTYNDRTENNVGAPCDPYADVPDCYSPFGQGVCLGGDGTVWGPDNYCSILDCAAPGMPTDACGPAAQCAVFFSTDGVSQDLGACFESCTTADTCNTGDACLSLDAFGVLGMTGPVCFPLCTRDSQCRTGQVCMGAMMTAAGQCR